MTSPCHSCGHALSVEHDFGRQERCPKCGCDTRCCKNCVNYDPTRYNECAETMADRVVDKEKSNFCDYFKAGSGGSGQKSKEDAAKAALDALFKK